jgi:hypothetical protein
MVQGFPWKVYSQLAKEFPASKEVVYLIYCITVNQ